MLPSFVYSIASGFALLHVDSIAYNVLQHVYSCFLLSFDFYFCFFFFFQAEDGIRDLIVTGVQTCALPICIVGTEFEHGAVAFFDLQVGLRLALWPKTSIEHDTGIPVGSPNATDFTIGHNVSSKVEVDAVMEQAGKAGAVVVKPAHDTFWGGYAGYFQDPDGHLWEVAWNPQWVVQD